MTFNKNSFYEKDLHTTRNNRERLKCNKNLLYWYGQLYYKLFHEIPELKAKRILEIGSGTSPLKLFYPQVITSDILRLDYVDHFLDCHMIDRYSAIQDHSIDIICLTNVLHHLLDPIRFLCNATKKLKNQGEVFLVEPFFSVVSYAIFKMLHHEQINFKICYPGLDRVNGPLSSANQAIPYMIFFRRESWKSRLSNYYDMSRTELNFFSSLSYMMTGGISRKFSIPIWIYRLLFRADYFLSIKAPRFFASFFVAKMIVTKKNGPITKKMSKCDPI